MEYLIGSKYSRRKLRMIRAIGEMLCFQAKSIILLIHFTVFPFNVSIQKIAGIKLQPWLIGKNFENTTAFRIVSFGSLMK